MIDLLLFTDGSVNPQLKIGYGAYLMILKSDVSLTKQLSPKKKRMIESLKAKVTLKKFEQTSSTRLELQTLLWALKGIHVSQPPGCKVTVVTDSQNIIGLQKRRAKLEQNNFRSKKNKRINNYELYLQFYSMIDQLDCEFVKIQGHKVSKQKNTLDTLFTLVDRASRHALRKNAV